MSIKFIFICLVLWIFIAPGYSQPNIVIFLTDDQGYTDFGANIPDDLQNHANAQAISTPRMDEIRASGVLFTDAHSNGNVCSPTRASLQIGRYSQRSGWYGAGDSRFGLDMNEVTIADELKKQGYRTGMIGKWHVGVAPQHNPINRGYDKFYGFLGHGDHSFYDLVTIGIRGEYNLIRDGIDPIEDDGEYLTWRIEQETIRFIDSARADNKPFYVNVCFNAVHSPAEPPPSGPFATNSSDTRTILMSMLSDMDNSIGAIYDHIESIGEQENTLYFLLSDNGGAGNMEAWNGGLKGNKGRNYEGGIRVPMVMSWKGVITPGTTYDNMVMSFDIFPTAVMAAGGALHDTLDGVDLMPFLETENGPTPQTGSVHEYLVWNDDGPDVYAIRNEDYKLFVDGADVELYDMRTEINEGSTINNNSIQNELEAEYQSWLSNNRPQPTGNNICQDPRYDNYYPGPGKHIYEDCQGRKDITGCTDRENPAYDWMANIHDESMCDEIVAVKKTDSHSGKFTIDKDSRLHITAGGLTDVNFFDTRGNLSHELKGLTRGRYDLSDLQAGVYFIQVLQGSQVYDFKHLIM